MATSLPTEVEVFHRFLGEAIRDGGREMTVEESVAEFRAYQKELARFHEGLETSLDQARRGEAKPLDAEALKNEIRRELRDEGVTD
ncbi:MAG: hypothetical protein DWQ34_24805 [Planctomycetota bacterium]|nr:MAG: hypothetical protein DWQ34_24805 [Planctomycetota bacterium]